MKAEALKQKQDEYYEQQREALLEAAVNEFNKSFQKTDPEVKAKAELEKSFYPPLPKI